MAYNYAVSASSEITVVGPQTITAKSQSKTFGDAAFKINAKTNGDGKLSYVSSNKKVAKVSSDGTVTIKGAGQAKITIKAASTTTSQAAKKGIKIKVKKAANTVAAKGLTTSVSAKKTAKKAQATKKLVKVSKAKGAVTFAKKSGSKNLSINKKTGKVKVKKGTKAGSYSMKVKVRAAGNGNYKATVKTVTVKVKVK